MAEELGQLIPGTQIGEWIVEKKLGEGGFGAVFQVRNHMAQYALKTEHRSEKLQVLKMELAVLTDLATQGGRHFCRIEDKGQYGEYNFVVMTLVGKSLHALRKESPKQMLTISCALSIGIQCLEALEDLHNIGFLHRDVKPGNYTIGRAAVGEQRKVYIIDFGMCRKFVNEQGVIRKPREAVGFRGTVRYAPIACHMQRELCRKDDIESWLYMLVEMTASRLPWREVQDIKEVGNFKRRIRNTAGFPELFIAPCPRQYAEALLYIDSLKYYDEPDYENIYTLMRTALEKSRRPEYPYDWEQPSVTTCPPSVAKTRKYKSTDVSTQKKQSVRSSKKSTKSSTTSKSKSSSTKKKQKKKKKKPSKSPKESNRETQDTCN